MKTLCRKVVALMLAAIIVSGLQAKDIRTLSVTTTPAMHCEGCETRIKENLRFEKGVKRIETDIDSQTVTITYDADKNTPDNLIKAFGKFGYTADYKEAATDSIQSMPESHLE